METLERLLAQDPGLERFVVHRRRLAGHPGEEGAPQRPLPEELRQAIGSLGISRLWTHQARGVDLARAGHDVLAATPTASGKTLLFALCVLESVLSDRSARALFLYPTKALAQDQVGALRRLGGALGALAPARFEIYDGDTPDSRRRRIRADPPQVLLTNPDMLHHGILAWAEAWRPFLGHLRWVVLDELHVYRGVFGAHVHHVLGRLQRLCASEGARPQFIAASATVGNPAEFAQTLVGRPFDVVSESGAPRSPLEAAFLNPVGISPYTVAVRVIAAACRAGLRTIAFTKARRSTELIHSWLAARHPDLADRVAPYRAGYLPAERRRLEQRLFSGELGAVVTTSALELGIDVGGLDVCVLVGYPGSLVSSWQRVGRVGRAGRSGLALMIAMPDALDQYVVRHPDLFFGSGFERAVVDPWNPEIAGRHLVCAAAERPLGTEEVERWPAAGRERVRALEQAGRLRLDEAGRTWYAPCRRPHRDVKPRGIGEPYAIVHEGTGSLVGTVDGVRVHLECHPGAIYLHAGCSYLVRAIEAERHRVVVEPCRADHYTVVLGDKETELLERTDERACGPVVVGLGRLRVTLRVHGYQKRRLFSGEPISSHPLEVPPIVFETIGFWIELPRGLPLVFSRRELHFMGGIHAVEHALIGLFPLLAIADRGDVGGISYTAHPQLGCPAIFVYDGIPGGVGLAAQGFADVAGLIERGLDLVDGCACSEGCPGCIQSPRCGNGNKPLDKEAARLVLRFLAGRETLQGGAELVGGSGWDGGESGLLRAAWRFDPGRPVEGIPPHPQNSQDCGARPQQTNMLRTTSERPALGLTRRHGIRGRNGAATPGPVCGSERVIVLDVETRRSAAEVGGWSNTDRMGLALAVVYDPPRDRFETYREGDVHRLLLDLMLAERVVGFNIDRFDLAVLSGYTEHDLGRIRTLDLMSELRRQLGFRLSLQHLAEVNLGQGKSADGLKSLAWWRAGRIDLIEDYCRRDVAVTHRLYELGRSQGYLLYRDRSARRLRVPVPW